MNGMIFELHSIQLYTLISLLPTDVSWVWDIFYNAGYPSIAAALFWHNRFFVFDEKREQKKWQKKNR